MACRRTSSSGRGASQDIATLGRPIESQPTDLAQDLGCHGSFGYRLEDRLNERKSGGIGERGDACSGSQARGLCVQHHQGPGLSMWQNTNM